MMVRLGLLVSGAASLHFLIYPLYHLSHSQERQQTQILHLFRIGAFANSAVITEDGFVYKSIPCPMPRFLI